MHANGVASDICFISTGVPQGSILGPLLFTIFINDFPKSSTFFSTRLYADDTSLTASAYFLLEVISVKYFFNLIPLRKHNVKPNCSELQLPKMATTLLPKRGSHNYQARQMISIHYISLVTKGIE